MTFYEFENKGYYAKFIGVSRRRKDISSDENSEDEQDRQSKHLTADISNDEDNSVVSIADVVVDLRITMIRLYNVIHFEGVFK